MERKESRPVDVHADFPDLTSAREAIAGLERAGVDGGTIALAGPADQALHDHPDVPARDAGVARTWLRSAAVGGLVGMLLGALSGIAIGVWVFGVSGDALRATALGMAAVGLTAGGLIAVTATLPTSPQYDRTFQDDVAGGVTLTVRTDNRGRAQEVAGLLAHAGGHLRRGSSAGRP